MLQINPLLLIDGYKADHRRQYPDKTELVYSNMTPRGSRVPDANHVVFFGLQYFVKRFLRAQFATEFFAQPKDEVVKAYKRRMDQYLGKDMVPVDHIADLHELGYLPIRIKALPEGTVVPIKVPMLTIENTDPNFFWLTNQLETLMSNSLWGPITSATIALQYRQRFDLFARLTGVEPAFVKFQGHDFSFRGMHGLDAALTSAAGHLTSFVGTDTVPALDFIDEYYGGDNGLVGCSVPASEHSVICLGTKEGEVDTFRRLLCDVYPRGIVSLVSDTWDFWSLITEGMIALRDDIMARDGRCVVRPDSGDPVKIVCGDPDAVPGSPEQKGAMEVLWEIFGGTKTANNFRRLDSHIGLIYGDSITLDRQREILKRLAAKGFASDIVLGLGSFSYQYVTRDTFGMAVKATYGEVDGQPREIFKDPKTDKGEKKSARGLLRVDKGRDGFELTQQCTREQEAGGFLETVFEDGYIKRHESLSDIRHRLHGDSF